MEEEVLKVVSLKFYNLESNHWTNAGTAQNATQSGTPIPANASTNSETMCDRIPVKMNFV